MNDTLQSISAVLLVLGLLGGTLWFLRRRGMASGAFGRQGATPRQMKVTERVSLGPQHSLYLVQVGERTMLVSTSPGSCQVLDGAAGGPLQ